MEVQTRSIDVAAHHCRTHDLNEISDFVEAIYAANRLSSPASERVEAHVSGFEWSGVGIYDMSLPGPSTFRSDGPRSSYLLMSCHSGVIASAEGETSQSLGFGSVMPISPSGEFTCFAHSDRLDGMWVVLDERRISEFVERWVGEAVTEPVSLSFEPLSAEAAVQWNLAATCLLQMMQFRQLPDAAMHSLVDHMLTLLLTKHRNSVTELLDRSKFSEEPYAKAAIELVREDPLNWRTVSAVALRLGCASSGLDKAIRRLTGKGFAEIHYEARLDAVRKALSTGNTSFVGTLRAFGFSISERFVLAYGRRFGEPPSATYRRNPHAAEVALEPNRTGEAFNEESINKFIDSSLRKPISLADLAEFVGMSEHATISVFKSQFSRTPIQYVIERRLERAGWLLRNTSDSILAVALACGFGTQSYLTSKMKQHWGVTPGQVRAMARSAHDKTLSPGGTRILLSRGF